MGVHVEQDSPAGSRYLCLLSPFPARLSSCLSPPGTEANNELCANIPGPACDMESGNLEDGPGEGFIHVHRGFHGVAELSEANYDWRNPVAEVFIAAQ